MLKTPPHSIEAERAILGSILLESKAIGEVAGFLQQEDFYDPRHVHMYEAMIALYAKSRPIDLLTISEYLDDRKLLENIGGNAYLMETSESVYSTSNIWEYAQIVKAKSVLRKLIKSGNDILMLGYNEESEINQLLEKAEQALFGVTQTFIQNKLVHIRDILSSRYDELSEIHADPSSAVNNSCASKFPSLDKMLGGFKAGDMVIVAARPSMGKTAFALNIAQNIGEGGKNVAIFSLEMTKEQLTDRMISASMAVDSWKLHKWLLSDQEFSRLGDALETLSEANIYIDDSFVANLLEIKSKARRLKMESGLDMIVIDYLQLMGSGVNTNRVQEISEISRGIKSLARELKVPIIALSQLSRAVDSRPDKAPVLSDLRESGSIEQDADVVIMLLREDYYDSPGAPQGLPGITRVLVRKNRNGPVGEIQLKFRKESQKFVELAPEEQYIPSGWSDQSF